MDPPDGAAGGITARGPVARPGTGEGSLSLATLLFPVELLPI